VELFSSSLSKLKCGYWDEVVVGDETLGVGIYIHQSPTLSFIPYLNLIFSNCSDVLHISISEQYCDHMLAG